MAANPTSHRPALGIRRTATGWQVYTKKQGPYRSARFPENTSLSKLKAARDRLEAMNVLNVAPTAPAGTTFAQDADDYIKLMRGTPSHRSLEDEIEHWTAAFGQRDRRTITAREIQQTLTEWRFTGSAAHGPLAPATVDRRRSTLMGLYTRLDGRSAANPVKDTKRAQTKQTTLHRAVDPKLLYRLLARIGKRKWKTRRKDHRGTRAKESKSRCRLRVMLWTGWPPAIMKQLRPGDFDAKNATAYLMGRKKGTGTEPKRLPLFPGAVVALNRFFAAGAHGTFSSASLSHAVRDAVIAENACRAKHKHPPIPHVRAYDFRHTFGTELARRITDERALKEFLMSNQIKRYTDGATAGRLVDARSDALNRPLGLWKVADELPTGKTR